MSSRSSVRKDEKNSLVIDRHDELCAFLADVPHTGQQGVLIGSRALQYHCEAKLGVPPCRDRTSMALDVDDEDGDSDEETDKEYRDRSRARHLPSSDHDAIVQSWQLLH
jgi:hypothetical protein